MNIGLALLFSITASVSSGHAAGSPFLVLDVAQQRDFQIDPEYTCVVCHTEHRRAFLLGVHSERGIRCHDCHGGDPTAFEQGPAHSGPAFVGVPDKLGIIELCSSCHSDPDLMRQYGLGVGQLAEYRTSRHGHLLLEGSDFNAPTCTDCHDAHTILPANDARSNVYPTNIVRTCARCHEDPAIMEPYGLTTDQVAKYRESAHGLQLFEKENFAAPTCVECHGSHAALPPRVAQVANVCGQCHVLVRRAFDDGPHGQAARVGSIAGCTACHSNHGTERVAPSQIAATCANCHPEGGPAAALGLEIQDDVAHATEELHTAREAIDNLVRAGRQTTDAKFRYKAAQTAYAQIAEIQHNLDLERLEDLSLQVTSISRDIRAVEEVAAEERWEHKLILIPVWFLALSGVVLAWFKLRGLSGRES